MDCKFFVLKLRCVLNIFYHALCGGYVKVTGDEPVVGEWVDQLDDKGILVFKGPLPGSFLGVSFPPFPLIILNEDGGLVVEVLLHEYGHIRAGVRSSEEEADFIMERCMWRGRLV